jgi:hypothetical protein
MLVAVMAALGTAAPVASWMVPIRLPSSYWALADGIQNANKRPARKRVLQIRFSVFMHASLQRVFHAAVNSR